MSSHDKPELEITEDEDRLAAELRCGITLSQPPTPIY